jgi:Fe-S cluster assembly ATP-binding protein
MQPILQIENLHATIDGKAILNGIDLTVNAGEIHAIMGPNGAGKSTLSHVLSGHPDYEITEGSIKIMGEDITDMEPAERALCGLFLAFQYPVAIPGLQLSIFLREAVNAHRKHHGEDILSPMDFVKLMREQANQLHISADLLKRAVNDGFSGGEKKRFEILQLLLLQPKMAIFDETDSGLDIDALKIVSHGMQKFHHQDNGMIVITHYQRLLDYVKPHIVHILDKGKIVKTGDFSLVEELETHGYDILERSA